MAPNPGYRDIYIGMDYDLIVEIESSASFPDAAADGTWTWTAKIDKERNASGTPDLTHDADSASLSADKLIITLVFNITAAKTGAAAVTAGMNEIDIASNDGSDKVLPWPEARGGVKVLLPLGT